MCLCGDVQRFTDYRKKLELQFGLRASEWKKDSEPLKLLNEFRKKLSGACIARS
jgi:hypothetical protein